MKITKVTRVTGKILSDKKYLTEDGVIVRMITMVDMSLPKPAELGTRLSTPGKK